MSTDTLKRDLDGSKTQKETDNCQQKLTDLVSDFQNLESSQETFKRVLLHQKRRNQEPVVDISAATNRNTLQHTATHCNTLQHTAT